jgi:hypothetical protein
VIIKILLKWNCKIGMRYPIEICETHMFYHLW